MSLDIVHGYLKANFRIVTWPSVGDSKGPREKGWPSRQYTLADYSDGHRVGILLGTEVAPHRYLSDVDLDWPPGFLVAQKLLPPTGFVFGRASKLVSHCFYLTPEPIVSFKYLDIDNTCLIELRGTMVSGEVGLQTMVPPSIWSKETQQEPLLFVKQEEPGFVSTNPYKQSVCLSAIGMILARNLGVNGFGHHVRLAWAGFLLRAGIPADELITMGEGISAFCNNLEVGDVRTCVESTFNNLANSKVKVVGGPVLARFLGPKGRAILNRINEWLGRDSDFIRDKNGMILKDHQENIKRASELLDTYFSYNEFADRMLVKTNNSHVPKLLDDPTLIDLWLRIDREYRFRPSYTFFEKVIMNLTCEQTFHPVHDYLATLTWDGVSRVDTWLRDYGRAEDSEYCRTVSALVLLAAVRRVKHPGCKFDEMLVLESGQGLNKSTALKALCPNSDWFSDDLPLNIDAKQMIERTLGKWIIEASDLAGKRKAEIEQLKATLSRQVDGPARLAYARVSIERPRQFIIIGTTNSESYLSDSTGARRFWPVTVQKFDVESLHRDCDQLWAEAVVREAKNESIRLPEHLWSVAGEHQEQRRVEDAWESTIEEAIDDLVRANSTGRKQIATTVIWELLGIETARRDRLGALRISEIMQKLGFQRWKIRVGGKLVNGYVLTKDVAVRLDFEEK